MWGSDRGFDGVPRGTPLVNGGSDRVFEGFIGVYRGLGGVGVRGGGLNRGFVEF